MTDQIEQFLKRLNELPKGYSTGEFKGAPYGATLTISDDGKRFKLFAQNLATKDHVSFNLYLLNGGRHILRPCEMSEAKVVDFVLGYVPDLGTV